MTESKLQSLCNAYLRKRGIRFYHAEKGRGKNLTHRGGFPDLAIFLNKTVYFVELKTEHGKLSDEQKEFDLWAGGSGYAYHVVRSFEDFQKIMEVL